MAGRRFLSTPALAGGIPTPPQAAAVGYSALTFNSSFTAAEVDVANTGAPGFNWYPYNFFGGSTNLSALVLNTDGSITLTGDTSGPNAEIASARDAGSNTFTGHTFGGGAYIEAEIKFDPNAVVNQSFSGFPSWWSMAIEHLVGISSQQWSGQATGYYHFAEVDFMEYALSGLVPSQGYNFIAAGWHDWYGIDTGSGYSQITPHLTQIEQTLPGSPDLTVYHRYGCLWVPATPTSNGFLQFYFDNQQIGQTFAWKLYNPSYAPPGSPVFTASHSSDDFGWQGNNLRQVINPSLLGAASGANIIVTYQTGGADAVGGTIGTSYVGETGGTPEYSFDGNQVQLTFNNGSSTRSLQTQAEVFTSDPVAFSYSAASKLVIAAHFGGTININMNQQTSLTGATAYTSVTPHTSSGNPQSDNSGATSPTLSSSEASTAVGVISISVQDYTPLSILDVQHLALILGTGVGEPMTIRNVRVWQASRAGNL